MNEADSWARWWVFLNRKEDRKSSTKANNRQHIPILNFIPPSWAIHVRQRQRLLCGVPCYTTAQMKALESEVCARKSKPKFLCKVANKMKWKSYAWYRRHSRNFPRQNSFTPKAAKTLVRLLFWQSRTLRLRNMLSSYTRPKKLLSGLCSLLKTESFGIYYISF